MADTSGTADTSIGACLICAGIRLAGYALTGETSAVCTAAIIAIYAGALTWAAGAGASEAVAT